ncbi:TIGR03986 family type III CRISPR-associated RAMP protein [Microtetraspora fusca]|uniref:TIGR03986 family type III CRISPR-associated RAMP protein n=1 Tax=Microtetraspora fusca TaxID=1997 RepID=UPI00082EE2C7|nr:TIGR03986 family CRISPR-associated RAMP protein [Microtetraspora fusca]
MTGEFLNPYTYIPAFPRERLPEPLRDAAPPPRDRLRRSCWTGRIGVALTVQTPLLLLDTARKSPLSGAGNSRDDENGSDGHFVYPVHLRDGRPHLPATSVKGMLRSAYEAITNSRLGVFEGHDSPLGFRRDAGFALGMVPVLVGADRVLYEFQQATLRMYDEKGLSLFPRDGVEAPRHLEKLRALVRRGKNNQTEAVRFVRESSPDVLRPGSGERLVKGLAFITGPNIERKTCERFFYLEEGQKPRKLEVAPELWSELERRWNNLIADYRRAHDDAELFGRRRADGGVARPGERIGEGPGQLAWSPHLYDAARQDIRGGRLCYARKENGRVTALYPVLVPRDLYPVSPRELLPDSLAPARRYDELSPADRVFGWVAPQGSGARPAAYRGRLRIGPVTCEESADEAVERFDGAGIPIAILGQPKPQQGRFYLAETADRPDRPVRDGTPKEKLYRPGRGLRGRKVYWHHAGLDASRHWSEGQGVRDPAQVRIGSHYREYRRSRAPYDENGSPDAEKKRYRTTGEEQRNTQNRSVKGWVRPGTTFRFSVDVRDLDDLELGALVWLLTLPPGHFHRLGLGRPLGFGSVRIDIDAENTRLHSGEQYAGYYRSLSEPLPDGDGGKILEAAREAFVLLVESSDQLVTVRDAVLAVARGNPELPVHYPRTHPKWLPENIPAPPDPRGRTYEWFTENERSGKADRGRSLPGLGATDTPLTTYLADERREDGDDGRSGRPRRQRSR